jgi:hypothetical protein
MDQGIPADVKLGRRFYCGIWDEGCVFRDYRYGNWISANEGSERSEFLRTSLLKRAKRALACARRQALRRS